jgi:predicted RNase H-like HicB family nuclease
MTGNKGALMETTTFTALCERAGRWWTIRIPQLEGLTAQARTLDQVEIMSRQVIARHIGVPPESIGIDVIPDAPVPVAQALRARHVARQAVEAAAIATRTALEALAAEGHTFPDAAVMLGLTPSEIEVYGPVTGGAATMNANSGPLQMTGQ